MNRMTLCLMMLFIASFVAGPALAQEMIIFPAKGQSEEQMEKDKYDCYQWAKKETGFDPMEVPKATEPPPQKSASGGLIGRRSRGRQDTKNQEQWKQEQAGNYQKNRNSYNRAYGACLEGKGYTVK
jgi:hypothetical protein